eukprot:TRINITY_DN63155_c0_g1_i1.p1 TRINITY_DN63155_c0_g1~~TRINITY_DN63155_c0_g1_i1.p1  ORF type:complete len:511 (+),score=98.00 TRINITY_DN63155_c0_g1_i1:66-1598(+)
MAASSGLLSVPVAGRGRGAPADTSPLHSLCDEVVQMLHRYSEGVSIHAQEREIRDAGAAAMGREVSDRIPPSPAAEARWSESSSNLIASLDAYRSEFEREHERWLRTHTSVVEHQDRILTSELRVSQQGMRGSDSKALLRTHVHELQEDADNAAAQLQAAEDAHAEVQSSRSNGVCEQAVLLLRSGWRDEQRKVLKLFDQEFRSKRRQALRKLRELGDDTSARMADKDFAVQLSDIMASYDRLSSDYHSALKSWWEARLKEVKRHAKEQADFFEREIQGAIALEQAERDSHATQMRRLGLSLLKWHTDYLRDAKMKAMESVSCRHAAEAADAAFVDALESGERRGAGQPANVAAAADATTAAAAPLESHAEVEAEAEVAEMAEDARSRGQIQQDDLSQRGSGASRATAPGRGAIEAAQMLRSCQTVLSSIWERQSSYENASPSDDGVQNLRFLRRVEAAVPATDSVLSVYVDFLQEHGKLPWLMADEGVTSSSSGPDVHATRRRASNHRP